MLVATLNDDAVHVRRARVPAAGDRLRTRALLESSFNGVAAGDAGLPHGAVLFVKRCLVRLEPGAGAAQGTGARRLRSALAAQLAHARNPWRDAAGADAADAVLFDDEAQLVACLIRDELRGSWQRHWWWTCLMSGMSAREWLQRNVVRQGERLAPALLMLAPGHEASDWLACLSEADAALALHSIVQAYALPWAIMASSADRRDAVPHSDRDVNQWQAAPDRRAGSPQMEQLADALRQLGAELLGPTHRRVMLCAWLAVQARAVASKPGFAAAMASATLADALGTTVRTAPAKARDVPASVKCAAQACESERPLATQRSPSNQAASQGFGAGRTFQRVPERVASSTLVVTSADSRSLPRADEGAPQAMRAVPLANSDAGPASARASPFTSVAAPVTTEWGGLMFLLNAALALGLWGDFTSPKEPGLALSPWDWLARMGRLWFGRRFEADPLWPLLAELAGRSACQYPGAGFSPPPDWRFDARWPQGRLRDTPFTSRPWWHQMRRRLQLRLARALACTAAEAPALLCCHAARLHVSSSSVRVHSMLADLPLSIRIAGLDRDPGWIPAAGRSVSFHFD